MDKFSFDGEMRKYMIEEARVPLGQIENFLDRLKETPEIYLEFHEWLTKREFPENGVAIEGYSAKKIAEIQPRLTGLAVYLLLAELRRAPGEIKGYLVGGLKIED